MLKLNLLGSGGATPYSERTTPMAVLTIGNASLLFDCGSGACLRLAQARTRPSNIEAIFLTHFHADHCVDLPLILLSSYLDGRQRPIRLYGPDGLKSYVQAINNLYSYIPTLVRNVTGVEFQLEITELDGGESVSDESWCVTAARARHGVPALGYRISTENATVVLSGDTEPSDDIVAIARGAQVLVHDCSFPDSIGEAPGHTLPRDLGVVAKRAGVKALVLTHLFQEVLGHEQEIHDSIAKNYDGKIVFGTDLLEVIVDGEAITFNPLWRPSYM